MRNIKIVGGKNIRHLVGLLAEYEQDNKELWSIIESIRWQQSDPTHLDGEEFCAECGVVRDDSENHLPGCRIGVFVKAIERGKEAKLKYDDLVESWRRNPESMGR